MSIINPKIQELIASKVLQDNEEKIPSGRLSASRLGLPLQWQMLHYYKIPTAPKDEYTLRKFARGKDVEDRIMEWLAPNPEQMQVPVVYRGVVGFCDLVLEYPIEVKSVTNAAFKWKEKDNEPSLGHRLQGELYAKAMGYTKFGIAYVASDDYRVLCYEQEVGDEVDKIIDEYEEQVSLGTVPVFKAREKWQSMKEYNPYLEWMNLDAKQITAKLADLGISTTTPLLNV